MSTVLEFPAVQGETVNLASYSKDMAVERFKKNGEVRGFVGQICLACRCKANLPADKGSYWRCKCEHRNYYNGGMAALHVLPSVGLSEVEITAAWHIASGDVETQKTKIGRG